MEDGGGNLILGSANFDRKLISINFHSNKNRERFTLGHEIGHFCLRHEQYLHSEKIIEHDLFIDKDVGGIFNYERLEFQANAFSSSLLLPSNVFLGVTDVFRKRLNIRDRGHGYIYVDDQPCNLHTYEQLLSNLRLYFEVSRQAIEIKLLRMGLVVDMRKVKQGISIGGRSVNGIKNFDRQ